MTLFPDGFRYLLISHVPFARGHDGRVTVDGLWARDLYGLASSIGPVCVAAPELSGVEKLKTWGPTASTVEPGSGITFRGLPPITSPRNHWARARMRTILRQEVSKADLIHTSNYFPPYVDLSCAHDHAVRLQKKTVFVIAEDFVDMLDWEWVRMAESDFQRWRRKRLLRALDARVRRSAATASLTFMHTPAAVCRYRLAARNGIAIRQPGHEVEDVISGDRLRMKCAAIESGVPLVLVAACRHSPLKGLEFLVGAVSLLASLNVPVEARIYGEGESTGHLQSLARSSGVADSVSFPGPLPPGPEIYRAIAEGHAFIMPHRTNDFGRAFFDAMAGGTPVVAFRTPASVDTVRNGVDGLLTPLDDVEGLAAAIRHLHENRASVVSAAHAARERALVNTREAWFRWRAEWTRSLFPDLQPVQRSRAPEGVAHDAG